MENIKIIIFVTCMFILLGIKVVASSNKLNVDFLSNTIYQFKLNDINNQPFDFSELKNKVVLIVNVASRCGFTSQYSGLQMLHNQFEKEGLVVIGVPSNDFGNQEPGSSTEIKEFCKLNYNVSFPILEKSKLTGKNTIDLYQFLTDKKIHPKTGGRITWNFNKFLIDRNGHVVRRYSSFTKPESDKIKNDIIMLLNKKGDSNE